MSSPSSPLVVATFNLRNGRAYDGANSWPMRRVAAQAALRGLDADVIGLQEVFGFQLRSLRRRLAGYDSFGVGRQAPRSGRRGPGGRGERCPILTRSARFDVLERETRWYGADEARPTRLEAASFPRLATIVRGHDRQAGRTVRVLNTHLDERHAALRAASAQQLAGWLDDGPTVVLGDLNTGTEAAVFEPLLNAGLRRALPADAPGTAHDFGRRADGPTLDHVLVSEHFAVLDAAVLTDRPGGRFPSDHWPVRVTLTWR